MYLAKLAFIKFFIYINELLNSAHNSYSRITYNDSRKKLNIV
ncbi:hypothetical protein J27TS7_48930 [Paenibacillus dendritiformis]|nr:hypothetical protein J27TS7_48930 [Paenibacillus dendritiformis]